jgi:hypothetical protein
MVCLRFPVCVLSLLYNVTDEVSLIDFVPYCSSLDIHATYVHLEQELVELFMQGIFF